MTYTAQDFRRAQNAYALLCRMGWAAGENEWLRLVQLPEQQRRCQEAYRLARLAYDYYLEKL